MGNCNSELHVSGNCKTCAQEGHVRRAKIMLGDAKSVEPVLTDEEAEVLRKRVDKAISKLNEKSEDNVEVQNRLIAEKAKADADMIEKHLEDVRAQVKKEAEAKKEDDARAYKENADRMKQQLSKWPSEKYSKYTGGFALTWATDAFDDIIIKSQNMVDNAISKWKSQFGTDNTIGSVLFQEELKRDLKSVDEFRGFMTLLVAHIMRECSLRGSSASKRIMVASIQYLLDDHKGRFFTDYSDMYATDNVSDYALLNIRRNAGNAKLIQNIMAMEGIGVVMTLPFKTDCGGRVIKDVQSGHLQIDYNIKPIIKIPEAVGAGQSDAPPPPYPEPVKG